MEGKGSTRQLCPTRPSQFNYPTPSISATRDEYHPPDMPPQWQAVNDVIFPHSRGFAFKIKIKQASMKSFQKDRSVVSGASMFLFCFLFFELMGWLVLSAGPTDPQFFHIQTLTRNSHLLVFTLPFFSLAFS